MFKLKRRPGFEVDRLCLLLLAFSMCISPVLAAENAKVVRPETRANSSKGPASSKPVSTAVQSVEKQSESAAQALKANARDEAALAVLLRNLGSTVAFDRAATVVAARIAGKNARALVPALITALKDESTNVRGEAATTLGAIGPDARGAVPALKEAAISAHPPEQGAGCCMVQRDLWVHAAAEKALKQITGK